MPCPRCRTRAVAARLLPLLLLSLPAPASAWRTRAAATAPPAKHAVVHVHAPDALRKTLAVLRAAGGLTPRRINTRWRRERALLAIEKQLHADPQLDHLFDARYGELGGTKLWSKREALVALAIGTAVNIGGFLQPELIVPYLLLGVGVDLGNFSHSVVNVTRARRATTLSLLADGLVPQEIVAPHAAALAAPPRPRTRHARPR